MRCWNERCRTLAVALLFALLAGCARDGAAPRAEILAARIDPTQPPALVADLRLAFSAEMLEALDRGIALRLELVLTGEGAAARAALRRGLTLRYLPLAQQYLLRDDDGTERRFARRSQLIAALDRVRVALPSEWSASFETLTLGLALDRSALPAPLRLPALYRSEWRLRAAEHTWRAGG
jgi:hypothetical protein